MVLKMEIQHRDVFPVGSLTDNLGTPVEWLTLSPAKSSIISSDSVGSSGVDYSELLVPGRVTASGAVPQGAMTIAFEPWLLAGKVDVQQVSVGVTSYGTLDLDKKSKSTWAQEVHWTRAIRLSDDCHSYNVQLKLQPSHRMYASLNKGGDQPKIILQAVRPIEAGQELQLWFSEDILAMLQVVFLNPSNIQGQKKYICNRCSTLYESPNPLKLHMTLSCGKQPISSLWQRLASLMKDSQPIRNVAPKIQNFDFKLEPELEAFRQRNALDLTVGTSSNNDHGLINNKALLYRPYAECSAFKPFRKQNVEINGNSRLSLTPAIINELPSSAVWPVTFETDVVQLHRSLMQTQALANAQNLYSDDAQIESLVSSLGKAKQGHICLYCGKCYSRKYGLKIHIRTHTGYKPLKCKFCDRPFGDPSNLNKHVRLHAEGNTPYKCDLCGKILVRRRDLERHLKSRHMVEMHPCQNILPDSPTAANEENSNNSLPEVQIHDDEHLVPDEEKTETACLMEQSSQELPQHLSSEEEDVKIIDISREDNNMLDANSEIEVN